MKKIRHTPKPNTFNIKDNFKLNYNFGYISDEGYRHFPILYFAYGTNGFTLCILGLTITIKL